MSTVKSIVSIIIFSLLFLGVSCESQKNIMGESIKEDIENNPVSFLALGDSYTIGQGVDESERWPNQLRFKLDHNDFKIEDTKIIAQTGWTTRGLLDAITISDLKKYNLISLLIGVNNQFQNQSFDLFKTEFDELLNIAITLSGEQKKVFVVSIPDYGVTPFGVAYGSKEIAEAIDTYNDYIAEKCNESDILFIDITEISRELGAMPGALASDMLHPSGEQYKKWADKILPKVIELLSK